MKAAIIAVGTEVTSGQILNAHAPWLSQQLEDLNIETAIHLTVPDDRALIMQAFQFCEEKVQAIFVTGGLGPTSDDFTRDIISQWSQLPLEFDNESFDRLTAKLNKRSVTVSESHKNQCWIPKTGSWLFNRVGTADGFTLDAKGIKLFALPGPKKELRAVWSDQIIPILAPLSKKTSLLLKWKIVGLPESEVADKTESLLKNYQLKIGYRLDGPYVEIKVWVDQMSPDIPLIQRAIDNSFQHSIFSRNDEDLSSQLTSKLLSFRTLIVDQLTNGYLNDRLLTTIRDTNLNDNYHYAMADLPLDSLRSQYDTLISISALENDDSWTIEIYQNHNLINMSELQYHFAYKASPERRRKILAEICIKHLLGHF